MKLNGKTFTDLGPILHTPKTIHVGSYNYRLILSGEYFFPYLFRIYKLQNPYNTGSDLSCNRRYFTFFLNILARSNLDHYARECEFGILKKKNLSALFLTK